MGERPQIKRPAVRVLIIFLSGILMGEFFPTHLLLPLGIAFAGLLLFAVARNLMSLADGLLQFGLLALVVLIHVTQRHEVERSRLTPTDDNEIIMVEGFVEGEPIKSGRNLRTVVSGATVARPSGGTIINRRVIVHAKNERGIDTLVSDGRRIRFEGTLLPFPQPRNPGDYDYGRFLDLNDIHGVVRLAVLESLMVDAQSEPFSLQSFARRIHRSLAGVFDKTQSQSASAFLKGIILAERSHIPPEVKESFVNTGTIHVLAVSGLHVGIVAVIFYSVLGLVRVPRKLVPLFTIAGLVAYMIIIGSPPSVVRATIMASAILVGRMVERKTDFYNSLAVAGILILMWDTRELFHVGFQLSFAAVFSIVYFYPILAQWIKRIPARLEEIQLIDKAVSLFAVSLAAQLGTIPFTVYYFERLSIISLAANVIVVPVIGLNVMLGFATLGFSPILPFVAQSYAALNELLVSFVLGFVKAAGEVPMAFVAMAGIGPVFPIAYYLGVGMLFNLSNRTILKRLLIALLVFLNVLVYHGLFFESKQELTVTVIDVGQGDAVLVQFPNGKRMLVDAGPKTLTFDAGERIITPYLKRQGIASLDALMISHAHSDHYGGAVALLKEFGIGQLFEADTSTQSRSYRELREEATKRRIPTRILEASDQVELDPATRMYVMHPFLPQDRAVSGNNKSLVVKLVFGSTSVLLSGDAEVEAEEKLVKRYGDFLDADLLKVGHHGSSTSSSEEFLTHVLPKWGAMSVGRNNKFRHPSPHVVARLNAGGIHVARTDVSGALVFKSDGALITQIDWRHRR